MWNLLFGDKSLVSGVEEDDSFCPMCEINPFLQSFFARNRSRRIIRKAEINNINSLLWYIRDKVILSGARHIDDFFILAVSARRTGPTSHNIAIDIDRIHRVWYSNDIVSAEDFLNIARIALGTVADEYFVRFQLDASAVKVIFDNRFD
ncbi:hypothetical protein ES703_71564 [subsurface metagenome]